MAPKGAGGFEDGEHEVDFEVNFRADLEWIDGRCGIDFGSIWNRCGVHFGSKLGSVWGPFWGSFVVANLCEYIFRINLFQSWLLLALVTCLPIGYFGYECSLA